MANKNHYKFVVQVDARKGVQQETVRKLLDMLINVGLSDAADTLNGFGGDGDTESAQLAVDCDFHSPVSIE